MGLQSDALEVLGVAADFQTSKGFVVMDVLRRRDEILVMRITERVMS